MASPQPPSVLPLSPPDLDNECSEIRTEVLQRLKAICQEKLGRETFPPTFWAFCQVADILKLEQMISQAESVDSETAQLILEPTIKDCDSIIDRCKCSRPHLIFQKMQSKSSHQGSKG